MTIVNKPFQRYKLDEERQESNRKIITISMNTYELIELENIKKVLNIQDDSTAIKKAAFIGKNVIQMLFSGENLAGIFNRPYIKKKHKLHKSIAELQFSNTFNLINQENPPK